MLEGIRSRFDQMRNLFANVQERQDSQAQENKAALSSWVNGALFYSKRKRLHDDCIKHRYGGQSQISFKLEQSQEGEEQGGDSTDVRPGKGFLQSD